MRRLLAAMKTTELTLWHLVFGFVLTTAISVAISVWANHTSMVQNQKLTEVSTFVASSQEFDSTTREYMRAVVSQSDEQEKLKQALIGNIQRQYSDLQVAKLYLGPNGAKAAEQYRGSLLSLTNSLRKAKTIPEQQAFLQELDRTLQLRKVVEFSLRKSADLPAEPPTAA